MRRGVPNLGTMRAWYWIYNIVDVIVITLIAPRIEIYLLRNVSTEENAIDQQGDYFYI